MSLKQLSIDIKRHSSCKPDMLHGSLCPTSPTLEVYTDSVNISSTSSSSSSSKDSTTSFSSPTPPPFDSECVMVNSNIIMIGFPRTGTSSLQEALSILNLSHTHHLDMIYNSIHTHLCQHNHSQLLSPSPAPPHSHHHHHHPHVESPTHIHHKVVSDLPSAEYYQALYREYPNAKYIYLIRRSSQKWYLSMENKISTHLRQVNTHIHSHLNDTTSSSSSKKKEIDKLSEIYERLNSVKNQWIHNREKVIENYDKNLEIVSRIIPEKQLLVYDIEEGWSKLCHFLKVKIPVNVEFPHKNDDSESVTEQGYIEGMNGAEIKPLAKPINQRNPDMPSQYYTDSMGAPLA